MQVFVNGEPRDVSLETTVATLLAQMEVSPKQVAVEINLDLVPRTQHAARTLQAGDRLEIVSFVGGG